MRVGFPRVTRFATQVKTENQTYPSYRAFCSLFSNQGKEGRFCLLIGNLDRKYLDNPL